MTKDEHQRWELAEVPAFALRELRGDWKRRQGRHDGVAKVHRAIHWGPITTAYSGLEQSLKVLAAHKLGIDLEQETAKRGKRLHGHHLGKILEARGDTEANTEAWQQAGERLEEHWAQFLSLHTELAENDEWRTLKAFLAHASKKSGYVTWRYTLIQGAEPPVMLVEALIAIWQSCIDIYRDACGRGRNHHWRRGPVERMVVSLRKAREMAMRRAFDQATDDGEDVDATLERLSKAENEWMAEHGGLWANAAAARLWHQARGLDDDVEGLDGPTRTLREEAGKAATELAEESEDPNLVRWAECAAEEGIEITGGYGPVRCTRHTRQYAPKRQNQAPEGCDLVDMLTATGNPVVETRDHLYGWGFTVQEHRCDKTFGIPGFGLRYVATREGGDRVEVWLGHEKRPVMALVNRIREGRNGHGILKHMTELYPMRNE